MTAAPHITPLLRNMRPQLNKVVEDDGMSHNESEDASEE